MIEDEKRGDVRSPNHQSSIHHSPIRYRLTIAYDGSAFHGWQQQTPPGEKPLRTVAGVIESVIRRLLGQRIDLVGASRTDAGVHARGQVAQFDGESRVPIERLAHAITHRLPEDVEVLDVRQAPPGFDVIRDAVSKQYRYRLFCSPRRPLELRRVVQPCLYELDLDRMRAAAEKLVGTHDFGGFANAGHGRQSTVRTIHGLDIEEPSGGGGDELHIVVRGDGFLYNMVRILAGTLVEVGRGHMPLDQIDRALDTADRAHAGPTLPPNGLWLEWIRYPEDSDYAKTPSRQDAKRDEEQGRS